MENKKLTPAFFFLSLGVIITLLTTLISLINVIFETLNKAYPDILSTTYQFGYNSYELESMRGAIATLIIAFPVYMILSYFWKKSTMSNDFSGTNDILKKWMIYLIIFVITVTCLVDFIVLVRYFVSGEITVRFIFKVISILFIGGLVGLYYLPYNFKFNLKKSKDFFFCIIAIIVFLLTIIYSFSIIGTPNKQRSLRIDQKRLEDLQSIQYQIINFWQQKEKIPNSLTDLIDPLNNYQTIPRDPMFEKGFVYEYKKLENNKFELCATFNLPIPKGYVASYNGGPIITDLKIGATPVEAPNYGGNVLNENWSHDVGRACFVRSIDIERYPIFNKKI